MLKEKKIDSEICSIHLLVHPPNALRGQSLGLHVSREAEVLWPSSTVFPGSAEGNSQDSNKHSEMPASLAEVYLAVLPCQAWESLLMKFAGSPCFLG